MDLALIQADLKRDEGRRDKPYTDSRGFLTIGFGHNLTAEGLCEAALTAQLDFDIQTAVTALNTHLPWWSAQPEPVQRVLVNLTFNLGILGLLKFTHTLTFMQDGNYPVAAQGLLDSVWAKQVGARAQRLADLLATTPTA
jgi:lysozyme